MKDSTILTGIDVVTTKVCTVVAKKLATGGFDVLAYSVVPSVGLQKGNVADIAATEGAVRESIEEVEGKLGSKVKSAYIGVTGAHVSFENRMDALSPINGDGVVTARQLAQSPEAVTASGGDPRTQAHPRHPDDLLRGRPAGNSRPAGDARPQPGGGDPRRNRGVDLHGQAGGGRAGRRCDGGRPCAGSPWPVDRRC